VIDFLDVYLGAYHWPAFNIADSAITVGIFIFGFHLLFNKMPE
jgi:signal peptidase II